MNKSNDKLVINLIEIWKFLLNKKKKKFFLLVSLMILSMFLEVISVSSVIPFLTVITEPDKLQNIEVLQTITNFFNINDGDKLNFFTLVFIFLILINALIKIFLLYYNAHFTAELGTDLRIKIYSNIINQEYQYHIRNNSSSHISILVEKSAAVANVMIGQVLVALISFLMSLSLVITLIFVNVKIAVSLFMVIIVIYIFSGYAIKKKIRDDGKIVADEMPKFIKYMQESFGGIRDILLDRVQNTFILIFSNSIRKIVRKLVVINFLGGLPKLIIEPVGIAIIAISVYLMTIIESDMSSIAIIGLVALVLQRLLPHIQQIYFSWNSINATSPILEETLTYLKLDQTNLKLTSSKIEFNKQIGINNLSFSYFEKNKKVLENINMVIEKGSKVGIIGKTGSGKSSLVDLIMGLLSPTDGSISIDNIKITSQNLHSWQEKVTHVPQNIYLTDSSIKENIAFGLDLDSIDMKKIVSVAKKSDIHDYITSLKDGYDTTIGESGVQLSGGQRQRLGIARALYKLNSVLVLDEATSALDNLTEKRIMNEINSLDRDLTVIIIAHRLTTLSKCDKIFEISDGKLINVCTYSELNSQR